MCKFQASASSSCVCGIYPVNHLGARCRQGFCRLSVLSGCHMSSSIACISQDLDFDRSGSELTSNEVTRQGMCSLWCVVYIEIYMHACIMCSLWCSTYACMHGRGGRAFLHGRNRLPIVDQKHRPSMFKRYSTHTYWWVWAVNDETPCIGTSVWHQWHT